MNCHFCGHPEWDHREDLEAEWFICRLGCNCIMFDEGKEEGND